MGFLESVNQALSPISGYLAIGAVIFAVAAAVLAIIMTILPDLTAPLATVVFIFKQKTKYIMTKIMVTR